MKALFECTRLDETSGVEYISELWMYLHCAFRLNRFKNNSCLFILVLPELLMNYTNIGPWTAVFIVNLSYFKYSTCSVKEISRVCMYKYKKYTNLLSYSHALNPVPQQSISNISECSVFFSNFVWLGFLLYKVRQSN